MSGRACIVTGSTTGIGAAIAKLFLDHGASVLVTGLPDTLIWDPSPYGRSCHVEYFDLSDTSTPAKVIDYAIGSFGKLDVLVNNAASNERSNSLSTSADVFDRIMAVNVRAPLLLCEQAFPHLAQTGGSVLNIGSCNGYCGESELLAYSISKGALHTMSRNLADAWGPARVRVNHFVPGWVLTENEIQRKRQDGLSDDWYFHPSAQTAPFGALTSPAAIAAAALYWCSHDSWPLSGNTIELEQFPLVGRNPTKRDDVS
jgi:NAD(P)-dependent dehydrogenase (short-subunit alcohol dehydrogenase family)